MMPFYGDPGLLEQAVASVRAQQADGWHLTVVDDRGPDAPELDRQGAVHDRHVSYVRNERNLGVGANFQRCLELSSADHVVFMGCDDLMLPDYVSSVSAAIATRPDAAAIQPRVRVIDANGRTSTALTDRVKRRLAPDPGETTTLSGEDLAVSLLRGNWTYFPAICWRRDLVAAHGFRADMETVLDLDLLLGLVLDGHEISMLPVEAFAYRRHAASASARTARSATRFDEETRLFAEVARRCSDLGWHRAERAARRHITSRLHAALLIPMALRSTDRSTARVLARHAVQRLRY